MATPMIEQFPKGKLNKCWHYIDLCKYVHPELTGTIDRMRDMLIRYTLIKPWPLRGDACRTCPKMVSSAHQEQGGKPWMRVAITMASPIFRK